MKSQVTPAEINRGNVIFDNTALLSMSNDEKGNVNLSNNMLASSGDPRHYTIGNQRQGEHQVTLPSMT